MECLDQEDQEEEKMGMGREIVEEGNFETTI